MGVVRGQSRRKHSRGGVLERVCRWVCCAVCCTEKCVLCIERRRCQPLAVFLTKMLCLKTQNCRVVMKMKKRITKVPWLTQSNCRSDEDVSLQNLALLHKQTHCRVVMQMMGTRMTKDL